ncbi:hypothetical protein ACP70R_004217 [Stipagrostis hirtigluma subsp. patula]
MGAGEVGPQPTGGQAFPGWVLGAQQHLWTASDRRELLPTAECSASSCSAVSLLGPGGRRRRAGGLIFKRIGDAAAGSSAAACYLFDRMPPSSHAARTEGVAADRLSALSERATQRVLSFLPSRQAVRTCVLIRKWRQQWRSVPALRITDADSYQSPNHLNKFVNSLLLFRERVPLREVEISFYRGGQRAEAFRYVELWLRVALALPQELRVLRVCNRNGDPFWSMPSYLVTSKDFKRLAQLEFVGVKSDSLDFLSCCPVLEVLNMKSCGLNINRIVSASLNHLSITDCRLNGRARVRISAPSLISLQLSGCFGWTPFLESMPSLDSAFVRLDKCQDYCFYAYESGHCEDDYCEGCVLRNKGSNSCLLLQGLSCCTKLELTAERGVYTFTDDLTQCPMFLKLRALLLNDWCITANLETLIWFLQHTPNLEKLTLQFDKVSEAEMPERPSYGLTKQPIVLKNLSVEVKCCKDNKQIRKTSQILATFGVAPEQIKIKLIKAPWSSRRFSFEQKEI